jgi:cysteine-rich repeat protein
MIRQNLYFVLFIGCTNALPGLPVEGSLVRCGDGQLQGGEACDDGNTSDSDGCVGEQCSLAACGDGFRRADLGVGEPGYEACDDGNSIDTDGCRNHCELARCGAHGSARGAGGL